MSSGSLTTPTRKATVWARPRRIARRFSWGLADQAVSSLTNFAISIYVARSLGATQYGAFALAYVTFSFILNASRGLATDPLMVRFSGASLPAWRRAVTSATGTALSVGLVGASVVLGVAAIMQGTARYAFIALGLTLPGLMLQDSWRYSFFALGRGGHAFLNDLIWAIVLVPGLLALRMTGHETVFWFMIVWGVSAAAGAVAGPLQARVIPRPAQAMGWLSSTRDLGPRYLAENTANAGGGQLRLYAVGLVVGLAGVGYVQAGSTLMGPFLVVFMGVSLVAVPEATRVLRHSPRHLSLFCLLLGTGLAIAALVWGVALIIVMPMGLGEWLLHGIWRPTASLVLPFTISVMGACFSAGATAGLHALAAARRSLQAMLVSASAYVVGGVIGAVLGGAAGSVWGTAVATWIGAAAWWWQLRVALRETGRAPGAPQARRLRPALLRAFRFRRPRPSPAHRSPVSPDGAGRRQADPGVTNPNPIRASLGDENE